jgi:formyl-CoA transferase
MGVTQTVAGLANCPYLEARQMFVDTGDTLGGTFRGVKTPARLTVCVDSPSKTAPTLGQHNSEILCSLGGMMADEVTALEAEGAL